MCMRPVGRMPDNTRSANMARAGCAVGVEARCGDVIDGHALMITVLNPRSGACDRTALTRALPGPPLLRASIVLANRPASLAWQVHARQRFDNERDTADQRPHCN